MRIQVYFGNITLWDIMKIYASTECEVLLFPECKGLDDAMVPPPKDRVLIEVFGWLSSLNGKCATIVSNDPVIVRSIAMASILSRKVDPINLVEKIAKRIGTSDARKLAKSLRRILSLGDKIVTEIYYLNKGERMKLSDITVLKKGPWFSLINTVNRFADALVS